MRLWDIYHYEMPKFLHDATQVSAVKRLENVGMNCGCEYTKFPVFADIGPYSRYDHSVGVALIVWHFTGDMTQSMAGLLHDIATPVFAHVIDFLRGDHLHQESTERETENLIYGSAELCNVLRGYKIPLEAVVDYHLYPIADNDSPKLSADRLEYTLGNAVNYGLITSERAAGFYGNLTVGENEYGESELVFRDVETALAFAEAALECSKIYVSDADRYAMQCLAEILKQAIASDVISEKDLYLTERELVEKLERSQFKEQWKRFCHYSEVIRSEEPDCDGIWFSVSSKKRNIDPYVAGAGRVSEAFPEFRDKLERFRESRQDYWISAR